jgi:hypothetical protein
MANPVFDPNTGALQGGRNEHTVHSVNAAKFFAAVKDQFSEYVRVQFGAVKVGEPESVPGRDDAARPGQQH